MSSELHGKHALVCGASKGIGRACAVALAAAGASVTVTARSADALAGVVAGLPCHSDQRHSYVVVDASDIGAVRATTDALVAERAVHILINNSGGPAPGPVLGASVDAFLDAFRAHVIASQVRVLAVSASMRTAGYGRIINVISTSVKQPIPGLGVSNTTRWAMAGWAKTLAGELGPFGITVNNVLPGSTETSRITQIISTRAQKTARSELDVRNEMEADIPLRRFAQPEEIAAVVAFLASPAASYVSGINLPVDGGRTRCL